MFGQVLDKISSYFGREFLLSRYVPWLLCIAANLVIAYVEFPHVRDLALKEYIALSASAASKAIDLAVALVAVWVVSYSTAPLVQVITGILEGGWLPHWLGWVGYLLVVTHAQRRERLDRDRRFWFVRRIELPKYDEVFARLGQDRAIGVRLRTIDDRPAIDETERLFGTLRDQRWLNRTIRLAQFLRAERQLSAALKRNCAEVTMLLDPAQAADARRLGDLHLEMVRVLAHYVLEIAEQRENRAHAERQRLFAERELAPTRLGNDAAALRGYCETRYGIEFELFWPRFLLLAQKDAKLSATIATAKIQLDFSILALGLTTITTIAWYVYLGFWGISLWSAALVFVIGPLAAAFWLRIVHASYSGFADLARSAVDLHRFDVLSALHRPLPASTTAEAATWESVNRLTLLGEEGGNVAFRHPAK